MYRVRGVGGGSGCGGGGGGGGDIICNEKWVIRLGGDGGVGVGVVGVDGCSVGLVETAVFFVKNTPLRDQPAGVNRTYHEQVQRNHERLGLGSEVTGQHK